MTLPPQSPDTASTSLRGYTRGMAGFALLLFASTWKLWTPQDVFPQIPFLASLITTPTSVDWICLGLAASGLVICLFAKEGKALNTALILFALPTIVLILLDQHRLQPWAYQLVVLAIVIATSTKLNAVRRIQVITVSIYIFSGVSKLDYQFVHTVGDQMLSTLIGIFGLTTENWPTQIRNSAVLCFPTAEIFIGVGLLIPKIRNYAVASAVVMHTVLLVLLFNDVSGSGVLIWNLFFIFQIIWIFYRQPKPKPKPKLTPTANHSLLDSIGYLVTLGVVTFPLTQPMGICDHWPAWQVYAPRCSRAKLESPIENNELWNNFGQWSNQTLAVPVYPQARFEFAVAVAAQQKFNPSRGLSIEISEASNRWDGTRISKRIAGDQIKMQTREYWLNTRARNTWTNKGNDKRQ
ncbi:hypothetical protein N9099_01400 [Mariniblastus sp.]|nr:hypothetical protein [Mariniblastus sp.]